MNWYYYSRSDRDILTSKIKNIDKDIAKILFAFDSLKLELFFKSYQQKYGKNAANYARNIFSKWKSGEVRYSAKTIEKLINLVPNFLSHDEKYELLKTLYIRNRKKENYFYNIVLDHDESDLKKLEIAFHKLCHKPNYNIIPKDVTNLMTWVCSNDSKQARKLMSAVEIEESKLITKIAKEEIDRLISAIRIMDTNVVGNHTVELPYGTIYISVRNPNKSEKISKFFKKFKGKYL